MIYHTATWTSKVAYHFWARHCDCIYQLHRVSTIGLPLHSAREGCCCCPVWHTLDVASSAVLHITAHCNTSSSGTTITATRKGRGSAQFNQHSVHTAVEALMFLTEAGAADTVPACKTKLHLAVATPCGAVCNQLSNPQPGLRSCDGDLGSSISCPAATVLRQGTCQQPLLRLTRSTPVE